MTALAARVAAARLGDSSLGAAAGAVGAACLLGAIPASGGDLRVTIVLASILVFFTLALGSPGALLPVVVVWLFALGTIRRLTSLDSPLTGFDPLLLAGPLAVALLVLTGVRGAAKRSPTGLEKAVIVLGVLIALSTLNPLQGSAAAGVVGAVSLLVPLAGFWIGRALDDRALRRVGKLLVALGAAAALYGLLQVLRGFPAWDAAWLETYGYEALNVGIATRPFSTFASSAENALFLAAAAAVCVAHAWRWSRLVVVGPPLALIAGGIVIAGTRGAVVAAALATGAVVLARLRTPPVLAAAAVLGIALLVPPLVSRLEPTTYATTEAQALLAHQLEGLGDPVGSDASTLTLHLDLARDGLLTAVEEPLGLGAGPITNAPGWLGGIGRPTELDPSNVAVAVGFPGLVAYLVILALGLSRAYALARARRDPVALAALGIVVATLFQWLNAGFYLVAILPWLALGWVDARGAER